MASSKKPTYKVETKLTTERKRRKSDLVIMWQSIWDVTVIVIKDLWITLLRTWEFIQFWFSSSEKVLVQTWLGKYLPYVPEDFSESWRDGRLLAMLLNKLRPGCFPDAKQLDPDYGLKNVYRVFDALEIYFGIKPNVSVEEIVTCIDGSDAKLFEILLDLKNLTDNHTEHEDQPEPEPSEKIENSCQCPSIKESCIAKGTGLVVGFVGKTANFVISCAVMSNLDVVVEIKGPTSICSERITKRSPRKKHAVSSWECARQLTRSASFSEHGDHLISEEDDNIEKRIIPLEYEIVGNQINLSYKPKEKGKHKVTILWHGQHLSDSPYFVIVENPLDLTGINNAIHLKSALKITNECGKNEILDKSRKISVRFQESAEKQNNTLPCNLEMKHSGKILSRRVLRYIVRIHGRDIPVHAENTESLATELLKMDYDFEKSPSFHRRNSWGFAGDAERKKSVIRQFCVDVNELDAQIALRRSRSGSKKLIQKSDSFESLATNLNIVSEDIFESNEKAQQNEEDYACINPDADEANQTSEVKYDKVQCNASIKGKLSSELTKSKFDESLEKYTGCETEAEKISSSSTEMISIKQVDDSDRDLQSPWSPALKSNVDKLNEIPFYPKHSDLELHENKAVKNTQNDHETEKCFQISTNKKVMRKRSKRKNYINQNQNHSRFFKKDRAKGRTATFPEQTFYRNVIRKKESLTPISIFRKRQGNSRQKLNTKENIAFKQTNVSDTNKVKESVKRKKDTFEYGNDAQDFCVERFHNCHFEQNVVSDDIQEHCIKITKENKLSKINNTYKNIIQEEAQTKSACEASKNTIQEFKDKRLDINYNLNAVPITMANSKINTEEKNICKTKSLQTFTLKPIEQLSINHSSNVSPAICKKLEVQMKDANVEQIKPLRTHSLKAIVQGNFKQFNPSFEAGDSVSPIKAQIEHWESTLSSEKQNASSQKVYAPDTEQMSVKEKLAFWENAYKTEQQNTLDNNRKMDLVRNKKICKLTQVNSNHAKDQSTGDKTGPLDSALKEKSEICNSVNQETNLAAKKQTDNKISAEFQISSKIKRRSFSDPVMLETTADESDVSANFCCLESSKNEYSCSSTDDNLENYDSDDSEDSGGDYILQSTEDEYIDDEISESASEYWGDMSIVKGWKTARCVNEYAFLGEEFLQNYQRNKSYPEQCKVFGIAVYYGHVAVKNRFQVYTGDAGFGNLSVSMQGFRRHGVSLITVAYARNDIYEVTYQVMTAGYYLISIRWMDKEIPGNPFVCKVTF